jgi:hypothetical protein
VRKARSACGVGVYERGKFLSRMDGKNTREYNLWQHMLTRCYSETYQRNRETYIGCTVSESFKNFQYFANWCQSQVGFGIEGWHLDKDVVTKGNKIYSEETCVFIPASLNMFLTDSARSRGSLPIGVSTKKCISRYGKVYNYITAQLRDGNGELIRLGHFKSPEAAFTAYKDAKESLAKELAIQWSGLVDEKVITSLNNFEVSITD